MNLIFWLRKRMNSTFDTGYLFYLLYIRTDSKIVLTTNNCLNQN